MSFVKGVLGSFNMELVLSRRENLAPSKEISARPAEEGDYSLVVALNDILAGRVVSGVFCDAILCDSNFCDTVCDKVCDLVCDVICDKVCDKICDQICDINK